MPKQQTPNTWALPQVQQTIVVSAVGHEQVTSVDLVCILPISMFQELAAAAIFDNASARARFDSSAARW